MSAPTIVRFRRRSTGEVVEDAVFAESMLRWFYENPFGWWVFNVFLNNKPFCDLYGRRMDAAKSAQRIQPFVDQFKIDVSEAEHPIGAYANFNAFFERKLRPGSRVFDPDPASLTAAGDGKLLVYPLLEDDVELPIKGTACSPAALLADSELATRFRGGAAMVLRLAPYDYHRFHFPDSGSAGAARQVPGGYHSVNPIALARVPDLFCRNKRAVTLLESDHCGTVAIIEVGAITIGTIVQTYAPGRVERGQEKGCFRYGGSTVVLLFEAGKIAFDQDLVSDSAQGLEVAVLAGTSIGRALNVAATQPPQS
jgi:phosphatidylserine decarboxylase